MARQLFLSSFIAAFFLLLSVNAQASQVPISGIQCYADPAPGAPNPNNAPPMPKGKLTAAIYDCINSKLQQMSDQMLTTIFDKVSKAVVSVLTLAIMFFAIKFVLYGTRQAQSEFFIMMLKLVIVTTLIFGIRTRSGIYELSGTIVNSGAGLQNLVLTSNGVFGTYGNNIFERMDSLLCKVYGISDKNTGKCKDDILMDKDMAGIGMMGGMLLAGPLGAKNLVQGGMAIAMLVGSFMSALYITIVAQIALTFLLSLSPVILPLMLFPATEKIFQKWRSQIISYSLQPMIMTVFISMMFLMLGDLVGTVDNFIKTAAEMSNNPGVNTVKKLVSTATTIMGPDKENVEAGQGGQMVVDGPDATVIGVGGKGGIEGGQAVTRFLKGAGTKDFGITITPMEENELQGLGSQLVVLLIVCGAMYRFMKELPGWASELAGGDITVPNLAQSTPVRQLENQFEAKR